jgi:methyl-accepting chemotaxis protein
MLDKISVLFNKFLEHFTFRQRFLLFSLIFVACVPLPFYWFIVDQDLYINNASSEIKNFKKQKIWKALLYDLIQYEFKSSFTIDKESLNEFYNKIEVDLEAIKNRELMMTNEELENNKKTIKVKDIQNTWNQIIESNGTHLINPLIEEIFSETKNYNHQNEQFKVNVFSGNRQINTTLYLLYRLQIATAQTALENLSKESSDNKMKEYLLISFANELERFYVTSWQLQNAFSNELVLKFTGTENSVKLYLKDLKEWVDSLNSSNSKVALIQAENLLAQNKKMSNALLEYGIRKNTQNIDFHNLIKILCVATIIIGSLIVVFFVVFHALTNHFLALNQHITSLSRGKFKKCFCSQAKDEFGPVGLAFDKMSLVIQEVVGDLQRLGRQLSESVKQISQTITDQNSSFIKDERKIKNIEDYTDTVATRTSNLADVMNKLTFNSEQISASEDAKNTLEKMSSKMGLLKKRSTRILKHLSDLKNKLEDNKVIFGFLTKISNQASLLSLNSAIEASNILTNRQSFNKITQHISRFSEKTAASSDNIQNIMKGLFIHIDQIYEDSNRFFEELNESVEKLEIVERDLTLMARMIQSQSGKFQAINKIMINQTEIVSQVQKSLNHLIKITNENSNFTKHLGHSMAELNVTADKLQYVLSLFFHPKQVEKLSRLEHEIQG